MKVCILGAGMAGLLAGKALIDSGVHDFVIYEKNVEERGASNKYGLHYLHDHCGVPVKRHYAHNMVLGTTICPPHIDYADKLNIPYKNSVTDLKAYQAIYPFNSVYLTLWELLNDRIKEESITPSKLDYLKTKYDLIISTVPRYIIHPECKCDSVKVWVTSGTPAGNHISPGNQFWLANTTDCVTGEFGFDQNIVIYNVNQNVPWYRYSCIFGQEYTEWCRKPEEYYGDVIEIKKVLTCTDLHTDKAVMFVGRFGRWERGYLAHQAYYDVRQRIKAMTEKF